MAKLTKKELKLLRKLRKSNLYPDLQEQLVRDVEQFGAEGINGERNKNKFLQEFSPEIRAAGKGPSEETPAGGERFDKFKSAVGSVFGGIDPLSIVAGPVTQKIIEGAEGTANFAKNTGLGLINRSRRIKELEEEFTPEYGKEEARKMAKKQANKEFLEGRPQEIKQLPNERPEDFEYRMKQREFLQPYLAKVLNELTTRKPDTLLNRLEGVPTRGISALQQGLSSAGRGLGEQLNNLGSGISGGIQGLRSRLNPPMNPIEQKIRNANPMSEIIDRVLREKFLGKSPLMQGKAYNLNAEQYPGLADLLNSQNNLNF